MLKLSKAERKGFLIVVEGIDGSGKGTQVKLIADRAQEILSAAERTLIVTKEPGGTAFGEALRGIFFGESVGTRNITNEARQFAMLAAHIQHRDEKIVPALRAGQVILSDRYLYSDFAYQDASTPDSITKIKQEHMGPEPDLLIHLHGNASMFLERAMARTEETHQAGKAWSDPNALAAIQEKYFRLFQPLQLKGKYVGVPADSGTPEAIFEQFIKPQIELRLKKFLKKRSA